MKNGIQVRLAKRIDKSEAFVSLILGGRRRPSWQTAKRIAKVTKTKPEFWLEASPEKLKGALEAANF